MLFGLGGGVGGGYFAMKYAGTPAVAVIGLRNSWQDSVAFFRTVLGRLGVNFQIQETSGARTARANLTEAMGAGWPTLAWVNRASLPYLHLPQSLRKYILAVVGVCGSGGDGELVLVDDRAPEPSPWTPVRSQMREG